MKNIVAFALIASAVVLAWFLFYKKKAGSTETAAIPYPQNRGNIPLKAAKDDLMGLLSSVVIGKTTNNATPPLVGGNCDSLPPALRDKCKIDVGQMGNYTGNSAFEYFTGNGALEMFTGLPGVGAAKPNCWNIWKHNIANPNGPLMPMAPGINCKFSNRL